MSPQVLGTQYLLVALYTLLLEGGDYKEQGDYQFLGDPQSSREEDILSSQLDVAACVQLSESSRIDEVCTPHLHAKLPYDF